MPAASWSSSLAIKELGQFFLSCLGNKSGQRTSTERRCQTALHLCLVSTFLAFLSRSSPITTVDIQIHTLVRITSRNECSGLLQVTFLDQVSHKRLVSDRASLCPCEGIQTFKISDRSQGVKLDVPKTRPMVNTEPRASRKTVAHRLSGTLNVSFTLSAFFDIPLTRQVRMVSFTLRPKKLILPSASFSSCCCSAKSLAFSSIISPTNVSCSIKRLERS